MNDPTDMTNLTDMAIDLTKILPVSLLERVYNNLSYNYYVDDFAFLSVKSFLALRNRLAHDMIDKNIDLTQAQSIIKNLNIKIMDKCPDLSISLERLKYTISIDLRTIDNNRLLSDIDLIHHGDNTTEISSNTSKDFRRRNYNKLLRAVAILIAPYIIFNQYHNPTYILSNAINPVSAITLYKYFDVEFGTDDFLQYIEGLDLVNDRQQVIEQIAQYLKSYKEEGNNNNNSNDVDIKIDSDELQEYINKINPDIDTTGMADQVIRYIYDVSDNSHSDGSSSNSSGGDSSNSNGSNDSNDSNGSNSVSSANNNDSSNNNGSSSSDSDSDSSNDSSDSSDEDEIHIDVLVPLTPANISRASAVVDDVLSDLRCYYNEISVVNTYYIGPYRKVKIELIRIRGNYISRDIQYVLRYNDIVSDKFTKNIELRKKEQKQDKYYNYINDIINYYNSYNNISYDRSDLQSLIYKFLETNANLNIHYKQRMKLQNDVYQYLQTL